MDLDLNIPSPDKTIASQQLLANGDTSIHGLIKKLKVDPRGISGKFLLFKDKVIPVQPVLVILNQGCLYYFKDENAKKPKGAYTLYGYNRIMRAPDLQSDKHQWVFQIEHASPRMETLAFSVMTQSEMEKWMKAIKKEMVFANRGGMAGKRSAESESDDRLPADGKDSSLSDFVEQPIYDDVESVSDTVDKLLDNDPFFGAGKCTDEDIGGDYLDVLEQPNSPDKTKNTTIAAELNAALARKASKDESPSKMGRLFGSTKQPKPALPSKDAFDSHRNMPLPEPPSAIKRSGPEGKSFKKPEKGEKPKPPEKPKPEKSEKPSFLFGKKKSTGTAPELPPWNNPEPGIPEPPPPRKLTGKSNTLEPAKPTAVVSPNRSRTSSLPDPTSPPDAAVNLPKPSFTKAELAKDDTLYWKAHIFEGTKEDGQIILASLARDGVYLVRDGAGGQQVLAVYCNKKTHKYVIRTEGGKYFLREDEHKADTMEEMLYHYHTTCLPNKETTLTEPWQIALLEAEKT